MSESDPRESRIVCSTDEVTKSSPEVVEIDGTEVVIFYIDGEYYAIQNTCPHQGGPLADGKIEDKCVYCPWHGWEFDLESGEHAQDAATVQTYDAYANEGYIHVV